MWHEARKQEKKIRSLMVDYRKRADRRREFYQKIKLDPAQFLRIYGRPAKIHLENAVAIAAESPQSMMPWQGDTTVTIDRFDVRAHLDYIPETKSSKKTESVITKEERQTNYERYRILVQNDCAQVSEEQCLQQIYIDEMFGAQDLRAKEKEKEAEKKKLAENKAAIGFTYEDTENGDQEKEEAASDAESEESVDSDIDLDNVFDVNKLTTEQTVALNKGGEIYGMEDEDFFSCMWKDKEEAEELRLAKIMEEEKAQYSGRKSRRERRAYKEKKLKERGSLSPPSYAAKRASPSYAPYRQSSSSRSRSPSPTVAKKKTFILSFGGSDDEAVVQGPELPPHLQGKNQAQVPHTRKSASPPMFKEIGPTSGVFKAISKKRSSTTPSRSRSQSPKRKRKYSSSSRSRSRSRSRRRSRSWRRRSYSSSYSRSRSRSRSRRRFKSRSRSRSSRSNSRDSGIKALPQFRRQRSSSSSSRSSSSDSDKDSSRYKRSYGSADTGNKSSSAASKPGKLSIQERMQKKMKKALNIQYKADKKARMEKQEKEELERLEREEELRNMAIELRRKEREKRHLEREDLERMEADEKRRKSRSTSRSRSSKVTSEKKRSHSGSRSSRSPARKRSSSRSRRSRSNTRKSTRTSDSRSDHKLSDRDYKASDRDYKSSARATLRLTHSGEYRYDDGREHKVDRVDSRYSDRDRSSRSYSDSRSSRNNVHSNSSNYRSTGSSSTSAFSDRGYRDGRSDDRSRGDRSDDRKRSFKLVDY